MKNIIFKKSTKINLISLLSTNFSCLTEAIIIWCNTSILGTRTSSELLWWKRLIDSILLWISNFNVNEFIFQKIALTRVPAGTEIDDEDWHSRRTKRWRICRRQFNRQIGRVLCRSQIFSLWWTFGCQSQSSDVLTSKLVHDVQSERTSTTSDWQFFRTSIALSAR